MYSPRGKKRPFIPWMPYHLQTFYSFLKLLLSQFMSHRRKIKKKIYPVMSSHRNHECRIYVGNLPPDIRTKDIEELFHKFGKITFIDLKNRRGPPFSFVEFDDPR